MFARRQKVKANRLARTYTSCAARAQAGSPTNVSPPLRRLRDAETQGSISPRRSSSQAEHHQHATANGFTPWTAGLDRTAPSAVWRHIEHCTTLRSPPPPPPQPHCVSALYSHATRPPPDALAASYRLCAPADSPSHRLRCRPLIPYAHSESTRHSSLSSAEHHPLRAVLATPKTAHSSTRSVDRLSRVRCS